MSQNQQMKIAPAHGPPLSHATSYNPSAAKARLLLVEDHDVNQILIQAMTKRLGYETELAADGREALERIDHSISQENPFDLVLMDIQMPHMDGYEATRKIRTSGLSRETLPIIAITANAFGDDIQNCLAAGMQAHISKPINISNLESVLQHWLNPQKRRENYSSENEVQNDLPDDLLERYQLRREEAITSVTSLLNRDTFSKSELRAISDQMHKLAGTAAMFTDANLGICAKLIEDELNQWNTAGKSQKMQLAITRFLDAV